MRSISDKWAVIREKFKTPLKIAALAALGLLLFVCFRVVRGQPAREMIPVLPVDTTHFIDNFPYLIPTALDRETNPAGAKAIDLSQLNGDLVLSEGGQYRLSGELKGSVRVQAPEAHVHLFLDGADIQSILGPAILCENAEKLVVTLLPGTENKVSDNGHYHPDEDMEACVYSACDLTLNGTGSLSVNALYKDAIRSRDLLKILSGEYTIRCKRTALHGNDGIYAEDGTYYISSEKYGLKTTKKGSGGRGNLVVAGGTWNILAGRYAFVTTMGDLVVYNCDVRQNCVVGLYDIGGRAVMDRHCIQ